MIISPRNFHQILRLASFLPLNLRFIISITLILTMNLRLQLNTLLVFLGMTSGIPISLYALSFWVNSFDESFPRKVFLYVPNVPSITLLILSHVILLFEKNFFF